MALLLANVPFPHCSQPNTRPGVPNQYPEPAQGVLA